MEEVDGIIIHTLRSVGCDIGEDIVSLHQFSTELIVEAAARSLRVIHNNDDIPYKLPPSMSAKFRVGTGLATALQNAGYKGEVGYQTFLYSNESDIRKVFMFLLEKLPKESAQATDEPLGASALLQRSIAAEVAKRLASPWTPSYCKRKSICWRGKPPTWQREGCLGTNKFESRSLVSPTGYHDITQTINKETAEYYNNHMKYVTCQVSSYHELAPSLLEHNSIHFTEEQEWENEWHTLGLASRLTPEEYRAKKRQKINKRISDELAESVKQEKWSWRENTATVTGVKAKTKASRFTNIEKLQYAKEEDQQAAALQGPRADTEEEQQRKREEELSQLKTDLEQVTSRLEKLQLEMKQFGAAKAQMLEQTSNLEKETKEKTDAFKVKKRTMDLLPDAENNIAKLQTLVDSSAQRLVSLAQQWEKHRSPLIEQYRELKTLNENQLSETQRRLEEIKRLQEKMKESAGDARAKEEMHKQLASEYERMTKDVNRSAYTKRILEIVGNIKKQKQDIDKILIDTKVIQKEINQLSGKLDRTFTVTDELIFRDAKKDEAVRKAYKFLAALHENCNMVINTVEETGVIMREIRDLEDQVEQESRSKVKDNLETITQDYQEMKKENTALMQKFKKQQKQS